MLMTDANDQMAIARLQEIFDLQKAAYLKSPEPSLAERLDLLSRIPPMIMANAQRIAEALNADPAKPCRTPLVRHVTGGMLG